MKNKNINITQSSFVDCVESIKEEDIKEDIKDVERVDDTCSIHQETENNYACEDIKEEINEEVDADDTFTFYQ